MYIYFRSYRILGTMEKGKDTPLTSLPWKVLVTFYKKRKKTKPQRIATFALDSEEERKYLSLDLFHFRIIDGTRRAQAGQSGGRCMKKDSSSSISLRQLSCQSPRQELQKPQENGNSQMTYREAKSPERGNSANKLGLTSLAQCHCYSKWFGLLQQKNILPFEFYCRFSMTKYTHKDLYVSTDKLQYVYYTCICVCICMCTDIVE